MGKESVEYLHHTIEIEVGPNEVHVSTLQKAMSRHTVQFTEWV